MCESTAARVLKLAAAGGIGAALIPAVSRSANRLTQSAVSSRANCNCTVALQRNRVSCATVRVLGLQYERLAAAQ